MTDLAQAQARILELEAKVESMWSSSLKDEEKMDATFYAMVWWRTYAKEWKKDFFRIEAENAALRQERDRLAGIVEKADALAEKVQNLKWKMRWNMMGDVLIRPGLFDAAVDSMVVYQEASRAKP